MKHYVVRITCGIGEQEFSSVFLFSTAGNLDEELDQCLANFYDVGEPPDEDDEEAAEEWLHDVVKKIRSFGYRFEIAYDVIIDVLLTDCNEVSAEEYEVLHKHLHDLGTHKPAGR